MASQMNETLSGRKIKKGNMGNSPHKFVWYNRSHDEFEKLTKGKKIGKARVQGRWLSLELHPGYVLVLGECGGKVLYHPAGSKLPKKYHLCLTFDDDSFFTATTQMWGAMELYEKGEEQNRQYIKGMKTTPVEGDFTFEYFSALIGKTTKDGKRSAKGLLTQDQIIPGLGNAIAQDILFIANIDPKHPIDELSQSQIKKLYKAIIDTVDAIIKNGGRYDEYDLAGSPGNYKRLMDKNAAGQPCPKCKTIIEKIQYLGGACYFCPSCQK